MVSTCDDGHLTNQSSGCAQTQLHSGAQTQGTHYIAMQRADEASQDHQTASQPPPKPATPNGVRSAVAGSQATSPASVLPGVSNNDAPSMPPPVDSNQAKYRSVILGSNSRPA